MQRHTYDLIVIGSGGGLKIALAAARAGWKTALIESREMGGTCLNRGCIPSKMLIVPADRIRTARRAGAINLQMPTPPTVDFPALIQRIRTKTGDMSHAIETRLRAVPGLDLFQSRAVFTASHSLSVDGHRLTARRICIAVGSRPTIPPIPGLNRVPFMTSEDALRAPRVPRRLIVLGGGYIACELGHAYGAFGAETHLIVRSTCLRREDGEIREIFEREFSRHHHLHQGRTLARVEPGPDGAGIRATLQDAHHQESVLDAEALLVATGVVPDTDELGLAAAGIDRSPDNAIPVDDHLRTTVPGVCALGDCIGRYFYRHAVNFEAEYLIGRLLEGRKAPIRYPPMPGAVFSDPEVASVGLTEDAARKQGMTLAIGRADMADSNMGLARGLDCGRVKLLADADSRRLIGAHIVGEDAATLLHIPLAIMTRNGTVEDLLRMIYVHPAFPEVIRDAARQL